MSRILAIIVSLQFAEYKKNIKKCVKSMINVIKIFHDIYISRFR